MGNGQHAVIPAGGQAGGGEAAVAVQDSRQGLAVRRFTHVDGDRGAVHRDGKAFKGDPAGNIEVGGAGGSRSNGNNIFYLYLSGDQQRRIRQFGNTHMRDGQHAVIPAGGQAGGGEAAVAVQDSRQGLAVRRFTHVDGDPGAVHRDGKGGQDDVIGKIEPEQQPVSRHVDNGLTAITGNLDVAVHRPAGLVQQRHVRQHSRIAVNDPQCIIAPAGCQAGAGKRVVIIQYVRQGIAVGGRAHVDGANGVAVHRDGKDSHIADIDLGVAHLARHHLDTVIHLHRCRRQAEFIGAGQKQLAVHELDDHLRIGHVLGGGIVCEVEER